MARTNTILAVTAANGTVAPGGVHQTTRWDTEYMIAQATVGAGTGTLIVEGRNLPTDAWVQLCSFTTDDAQAILRMPQIQARATGATGLTAVVTVSESVKLIAGS